MERLIYSYIFIRESSALWRLLGVSPIRTIIGRLELTLLVFSQFRGSTVRDSWTTWLDGKVAAVPKTASSGTKTSREGKNLIVGN